MKIAWKIALPLLILAAGVVGLRALMASRPEPGKRAVEVVPPLVRVATVEVRDVRFTIRSQGTVAPRTESALVSEVAGRVIDVSPAFVAGGHFAEGDALLRIDPFDYEQAVVEAEARVAQAELRLAREEAEAELARREWSELGAGDASALTRREPQLADARAALAAARAGLERARRDLERTTLRAPYAGRVRSEQVNVGQFLVRGAPLATIYAIDVAEVRLPIDDAELAVLDLPLRPTDGARASLPRVVLHARFAGGRHEWAGRIVRTEGEIDPRSRLVYVVAEVRDPYARRAGADHPPLEVGLFVEAEIEGRTVPGLVAVPRSALRGADRVLVVDSDDRLRPRQVEIVRAEGDTAYVGAGLRDGERICLSPLAAVTDGMRVRTEDTGESERGA